MYDDPSPNVICIDRDAQKAPKATHRDERAPRARTTSPYVMSPASAPDRQHTLMSLRLEAMSSPFQHMRCCIEGDEAKKRTPSRTRRNSIYTPTQDTLDAAAWHATLHICGSRFSYKPCSSAGGGGGGGGGGDVTSTPTPLLEPPSAMLDTAPPSAMLDTASNSCIAIRTVSMGAVRTT